MQVTHMDLTHLEHVDEFSPALKKWIKFRLDCEISENLILDEINHASKIIIDSILNPTCIGGKS